MALLKGILPRRTFRFSFVSFVSCVVKGFINIKEWDDLTIVYHSLTQGSDKSYSVKPSEAYNAPAASE